MGIQSDVFLKDEDYGYISQMMYLLEKTDSIISASRRTLSLNY